MQTLPELPLSASATLGAGIRLGWSVFGKLFLVTTALALVQSVPTLVFAVRFGDATLTPQEMWLTQFSGSMALLQLMCLLGLLLIQAVAVTRLNSLATGAKVDYVSEMRRGLQAFPYLLVAFILGMLIGIVAMLLAAAVGSLIGLLGALLLGRSGFMAFLILAMLVMMIYVLVYLIFAQYSIVLERSGPIQAINRSFNLVYGHWWHAFAVVILGVLCLLAIELIVTVALIPLILSAGGLGNGRMMFVSEVFQMAVSAFLTPFILSVTYMLYHDLNLRSKLQG